MASLTLAMKSHMYIKQKPRLTTRVMGEAVKHGHGLLHLQSPTSMLNHVNAMGVVSYQSVQQKCGLCSKERPAKMLGSFNGKWGFDVLARPHSGGNNWEAVLLLQVVWWHAQICTKALTLGLLSIKPVLHQIRIKCSNAIFCHWLSFDMQSAHLSQCDGSWCA